MSLFHKFCFKLIEKRVQKIYSKKFYEFGESPKSVFWKNLFTQDLRLSLILEKIKIENDLNNKIICDVGCGYGRFCRIMSKDPNFKGTSYLGLDINKNFIKYCKNKYNIKNYKFEIGRNPYYPVDFTIMSGTYNLCTFENTNIWEKYILSCLDANWKFTKNSMIFNLLTKKNKNISQGLYYCEVDWIENYCQRNYGKTKI